MRETISSDEEKANWHPGEEGRLTKDEAHDEANMVRAKAGVRPGSSGNRITNPDRYDYRWDSRNATKEDYDQAFAVINQLKEAAKDEPTYQKVAAQIMRVAARPVQDFLHSLDVLASGPSIRKDVENWHEKRLKTFEDAEKRLRDMQKPGEKFGKEELSWNRDVTKAE